MLKPLLVLSIVICLLMVFLLTPLGTKTVINMANNLVDSLIVDYQSGGLGSELHLSLVKWEQPAINVDIHNLRLSIQLTCVWRFAVCIDSVAADKMVVQIQNTNPSLNAQPITEAITLPLPVSIDNISLNNFSLKSQDTAQITWQKLTAKLDFYQRLRIEKMQLDGFNLVTYATKTPQLGIQAQPFDWIKWQYQPITFEPIVLPMHFDVLAFNMSAVSVQLAGQKHISLDMVSIKAKGNSQKVLLDELVIEHEKGQLLAKGHVQLNGRYEHIFSVDAKTQWVDQTPLKLTLRSSGNIDSVATQVELIETATSSKVPTPPFQAKPLSLDLDITAQPSKSTLPLKIRLNWRDLVWPLSAPELKSEIGLIDINGDLDALKITVQTMLVGKNVPDSQINLSAIAALTPHNKIFEVEELLLETLGGQVLSQGKLTAVDYINWQGSANFSQLDPSIFWPELIADINGEVTTQANNSQGIWKVKLNKLDINGQWQGYPLYASGSADYHQNKGLQLNALSLKNAGNTLLLDGGVSEEKALDIKFVLDAVDLSNTLPQIGGVLHLVGNVSGSTEQPDVSYELLGRNLVASKVSVEQLAGKGNIKWNEQKPVALNLELTGIQGLNNQVDRAKIVLIGDARNHQLELTTSGQNTGLNVSIQGQLNQTSWQGNWLSGDIKSSYANLTLVEPFKIEADWANQQYMIAPHCWRHINNELCIKQAEFKQNTAVWDLSLKEFDVLSVVSSLMPDMPKIHTESRFNLDVSGDWNIQQLPNANLSASFSSGDWVFSEQNNLQLSVDKMLVEANITQKHILANINLSGDKMGALIAKVTLDAQSGVYVDPLSRPIKGDLLIEDFDLATIKALIPQLGVLQGAMNGQAHIDGTLGHPLLTGKLKLAKGALKDESLPVALSEIEQSITLKGQSADFEGSYKLGEGLGIMKGDITWIPTLAGHLHISGDDLEFDYQNMLKAKVSPDINLMFEPNNLEINGEVTIPYARVKVRDLPKGSISPSKDVILVEKQAEMQASPHTVALNLLLKVDPLRSSEVKLDAFGLTTDLHGELRLKNNKSEIFGSGQVQLVNGRYRAYGQNLIIRDGDILFNSTLDRPFLIIEAVRDPDLTSGGVIAGLRIEGVAQNPAISVFSEPDMEQQQILSFMLTGRGIGESSGDSDNIILTNALLSLGLGQSENLISKVGNKLGFEDVNLDTSGQGDTTQLSLTGTIAPGVQLRYGVGVFDSISEVAIRYKLLPKLYIEAVSGLSNAIDIYYQFSIEGSQNKQVAND